MAKNLFIWLLIILLLIASGVVGLELFGQEQFRPSGRFGITKNSNLEVMEKLQSLDQKLDKIQASQTLNANTLPSSSNLANDTKNATSAAVTGSGANLPPITETELAKLNADNPIRVAEFAACLKNNGKDASNMAAIAKSSICVDAGQFYRPVLFDIEQEILTLVETDPTNSKFVNTKQENFTLGNSKTSLFNQLTAKAGDKYKVSARVQNQNLGYELVLIGNLEKVI